MAVSRPGAKGLNYNVKITKKNKIECTVAELASELNLKIPPFLKHLYNTEHQYQTMSEIRKNLKENELFIVIDFSENYNCKFSEEIQSVHFGASKKQISLHTGAFFYKEENSGEIKCISFCSLSECLRHDASAFWAHVKPVLDFIKVIMPDLKVIHFQSDGPSTQYKNKSNFYLFNYYCNKLGLQNATWNFTTPGHG